jgi:hypothetical protein
VIYPPTQWVVKCLTMGKKSRRRVRVREGNEQVSSKELNEESQADSLFTGTGVASLRAEEEQHPQPRNSIEALALRAQVLSSNNGMLLLSEALKLIGRQVEALQIIPPPKVLHERATHSSLAVAEGVGHDMPVSVKLLMGLSGAELEAASMEKCILSYVLTSSDPVNILEEIEQKQPALVASIDKSFALMAASKQHAEALGFSTVQVVAAEKLTAIIAASDTALMAIGAQMHGTEFNAAYAAAAKAAPVLEDKVRETAGFGADVRNGLAVNKVLVLAAADTFVALLGDKALCAIGAEIYGPKLMDAYTTVSDAFKFVSSDVGAINATMKVVNTCQLAAAQLIALIATSESTLMTIEAQTQRNEAAAYAAGLVAQETTISENFIRTTSFHQTVLNPVGAGSIGDSISISNAIQNFETGDQATITAADSQRRCVAMKDMYDGIREDIRFIVKHTFSGDYDCLLAAAKGGHTEAMFALGFLLERQTGGETAETLRWYKMAADVGHAAAQTILGILQFEASGRLLQNVYDATRGMGLLQAAAVAGCARAKFLIGHCEYKHLDGKGEVLKAARYFRAAARQGLPEAMWQMGEMFRLGSFCDIRMHLARLYIKRAARKGVAAAVERMKGLRGCFYCGATHAPFACKLCRQARYCDTVCSGRHWSDGDGVGECEGATPHKETCSRRHE